MRLIGESARMRQRAKRGAALAQPVQSVMTARLQPESLRAQPEYLPEAAAYTAAMQTVSGTPIVEP